MKTLTTIMPTMSRPDRAKEAFDSHDRTAILDGTSMLPITNGADGRRQEYLQWFWGAGIDYEDGRGTMVQLSNMAARRLVRKGVDIIGWSADDQIFRTDGWDARVIHEFSNPNVAFVMTNDLHYGAEKAVNIYTRAEIIKALDWFLYPELQHLYVDNVWVELGNKSNSLVFLQDVIVEHMHPVYGKAKNDAQYDKLHMPENYKRDGEAFEKWKAERMDADAKVVRECLESLR